ARRDLRARLRPLPPAGEEDRGLARGPHGDRRLGRRRGAAVRRRLRRVAARRRRRLTRAGAPRRVVAISPRRVTTRPSTTPQGAACLPTHTESIPSELSASGPVPTAQRGWSASRADETRDLSERPPPGMRCHPSGSLTRLSPRPRPPGRNTL